jgi:hypothetical protein
LIHRLQFRLDVEIDLPEDFLAGGRSVGVGMAGNAARTATRSEVKKMRQKAGGPPRVPTCENVALATYPVSRTLRARCMSGEAVANEVTREPTTSGGWYRQK